MVGQSKERLEEDKPQDIVMRWANHQLLRRGGTLKNGISNMSAHLRDGEKLAALISTAAGEGVNGNKVNDRETEEPRERSKNTPEEQQDVDDTKDALTKPDERKARPDTFFEAVLNEIDPSKRVAMC